MDITIDIKIDIRTLLIYTPFWKKQSKKDTWKKKKKEKK